jgi:hypothetical protein
MKQTGSTSLNMTITNSEFRDTTVVGNPSNDAFLINAFNTATTTVTATGSTFKNVEVGGFQYNGNDGSSGTVNVRKSSFENTGSDILLAHGGGSGGNSTLNYDVSGNTTRQTTGNPFATVAMNFFLAGNSGASSVMSGTIKNNTIGNSGVPFSGSHVGDGMDANATGAGTLTTTVGTGPIGSSGTNTIHQIKTGDVFFGEANSGSAKLKMFIHANSFSTDNAGATAALHIVGSAVNTDSAIACADVSANILNGASGYTSVELDTFAGGINLPGYGGAANDTTAIAAFFNSANTTSPAANSSFMVQSGGTIQSVLNCGVTFP